METPKGREHTAFACLGKNKEMRDLYVELFTGTECICVHYGSSRVYRDNDKIYFEWISWKTNKGDRQYGGDEEKGVA